MMNQLKRIMNSLGKNGKDNMSKMTKIQLKLMGIYVFILFILILSSGKV